MNKYNALSGTSSKFESSPGFYQLVSVVLESLEKSPDLALLDIYRKRVE